MNGQIQDLTRSLIEFALRGEVPVSIQEHGAALLADANRRCAKGADASSVEIVVTVLKELGRQPDDGHAVNPVGRSDALTVNDAALVNGIALRSTFNGSGAVDIAFVPVAAAILSYEQEPFTREAVDAFCVGAEANQRILELTGETQQRRGWDAPSLVGTLGATLSIARLLALSAEETENATGIALTQGSGLLLAIHSMTGLLQAGRAAQNAVTACLMARDGFTGPTDSLDNRRGLVSTTAPEVDLSSLVDHLGTSWAMANETSAEA